MTHEFIHCPVFAFRATYVQPSCSCGWVAVGLAFQTSREAKDWWRNHVRGEV